MTIQSSRRRSPRSTRSGYSGIWLPLSLVGLAAIPTAAGSLRLFEVLGGPVTLPTNARIAASPAPFVVHIICGCTFLLLGSCQFFGQFRRRFPRWHRRAGRGLILLGLGAALSAIWMTLFYARQPGTGELLYLFRLLFGSGMAASVLLGFAAIRRRDITQHRAWMTRAYALALGAGTQAFTQGIGQGIFGKSVMTKDLSLIAGWAINLTVAEYAIRRNQRGRGRARRACAPARVATVS